MTRTTNRARGLVDPQTGSLLDITEWSVGWSIDDRPRVDVTPDHSWECAAAGGGAIVLAGEGWLTWRGAGDPVRVEAPGAYRVAVAGRLVTAVTADGVLLAWPDLDVTREPIRARVAFEPDDLACDSERMRIAVAGWLEHDDATMTAFDVRADELIGVHPLTPWPIPTGGVAFPLTDGGLGVATSGAVVVVAPDGRLCSSLEVTGVERLAGYGSELAWVRIVDAHSRPVIGTARITDGKMRAVLELPVPGDDPFPHVAMVTDGLVVVVGSGSHSLMLYRLMADGWSEPIRYDLPRRASR